MTCSTEQYRSYIGLFNQRNIQSLQTRTIKCKNANKRLPKVLPNTNKKLACRKCILLKKNKQNQYHTSEQNQKTTTRKLISTRSEYSASLWTLQIYLIHTTIKPITNEVQNKKKPTQQHYNKICNTEFKKQLYTTINHIITIYTIY